MIPFFQILYYRNVGCFKICYEFKTPLSERNLTCCTSTQKMLGLVKCELRKNKKESLIENYPLNTWQWVQSIYEVAFEILLIFQSDSVWFLNERFEKILVKGQRTKMHLQLHKAFGSIMYTRTKTTYLLLLQSSSKTFLTFFLSFIEVEFFIYFLCFWNGAKNL